MDSRKEPTDLTLEEMVCASKGHNLKIPTAEEFLSEQRPEEMIKDDFRLLLMRKLFETDAGQTIIDNFQVLYCLRCKKYTLMEQKELQAQIKKAIR